jgi:hypothetical protein
MGGSGTVIVIGRSIGDGTREGGFVVGREELDEIGGRRRWRCLVLSLTGTTEPTVRLSKCSVEV